MAWVNFLQNHDQVGNRAFGERINALSSPEALPTVTAILLLSPMPPLLFMSQKWSSRQPFPFLCDFQGGPAAKVKKARMRAFAGFPEFQGSPLRQRISYSVADETFHRVILDWKLSQQGPYREWLEFHRHVLAVREDDIVPCLSGTRGANAESRIYSPSALRVNWRLGDGAQLSILAKPGEDVDIEQPQGAAL